MAKILVIFDIDGTLLYSNYIDSQCFAQTYEEIYGLPFPTIDWTRFPHVTDNNIFKTVIKNHFSRETTDHEIRAFQDRFVQLLEENRKTRPEEFKEVPHARRVVEKLLSDDRFIVGIATGGWHRPALVKLNHLGFSLDEIILSCADGKDTREAIIQVVLKKASLKHDIKRITYVGDAPWDLTTTRNMGLNFVGIRRRGDRNKLRKAGASHVLIDFRDFDKFMEAVMFAIPPGGDFGNE